MFALIPMERFLDRCYLLLWSMPEVFLSGFLWQAFGLSCGCDSTSTSYFFLTGFGGALGAMMGHLLSRLTFVDGMLVVPRRARNKSMANFIAMFLGSATVWQKVANDSHNMDMNFTQAFFFVFIVAFTIFLTTLAVLRTINELVKGYFGVENDLDTVRTRFWYDVQLSLSVAMADAFFLGTTSGLYSDNSLGGIFGVNSDTPAFEGLMKCGAAAMLGFAVAQVAQNAVVEECWIDRPPSKLPDNKVPLIV